VDGLRAGAPWAAAELVRGFGAHVQRVSTRIHGAGDADRDDLLQEVFARAIANVRSLAEPAALRSWLTTLTIYTARELIRRRRRRRWLTFHDEPPDAGDPTTYASDDVREAARCVYAVFARMPADERVPLALRAIEGMELAELADACGMSMSTLRRRLVRAERRFRKLARDYEALTPWMRR
jgi:RNA polymerase sigma-70 factor (ECF subfamily)